MHDFVQFVSPARGHDAHTINAHDITTRKISTTPQIEIDIIITASNTGQESTDDSNINGGNLIENTCTAKSKSNSNSNGHYNQDGLVIVNNYNDHDDDLNVNIAVLNIIQI